MKNKGWLITLIVILAVLAIGLAVFMIAALEGRVNGMVFMFGYNVSNELVVAETYDGEFDEIFVESDASNIIIKETNESRVNLTIYGDKDKTTVEQTGSKLDIKTKAKKCFGICFNMKMAKVEISIPKDYAGKLNLKNKYGDTEVGYFEGASMDIENNYGDIDVGAVKTLNVKEDCGNVSIGTVEDAVVKNNFGDIKIDRVTNYVDLKNSCGNIKINDCLLNEDSYIEDNMGDIKISSLNEVYVDAKTSLGDVKVRNNYRDAEVTLKIENDCGDIKVEN